MSTLSSRLAVRLSRRVGAAVGMLAVSTSAFAVSFDCSKAHSVSEKLICADPALSAADDTLAQVYRAARDRADDRAAFKRDSDAAWNWRESHCSDRACLSEWYTNRIAMYTSGSKPVTNSGVPARSPTVSASTQTDDTDGFTLYYETVDYSVMVCKSARDSMVANLISHGMAFGDTQEQGEWLEKQKQEKACFALAPGRKFVISAPSPVYMRSLNNVMWAIQVLPPSDRTHPLGFVPLNQIKFIPIPTL